MHLVYDLWPTVYAPVSGTVEYPTEKSCFNMLLIAEGGAWIKSSLTPPAL